MTDMALALGRATHKSCEVYLSGHCKAASVSLCLKCLESRAARNSHKGGRHASHRKSN